MDIKSRDLQNLTLQANDVVFDTASRSFVIANGSSLANYDVATDSVSSKSNWSSPDLKFVESQKKEDKSCPVNATSLRFTPVSAQPKLLVSSSGFLVTAMTINEEMAVANFGFSAGVHCWEIICPKSCTSIQVGIIKEGWSLTNNATNTSLFQIHSFKTTTPRVIGMKLDLNKGELHFWLNGIYQNQRTMKKLAPGTWYPCVKLKDNGTHIILNPFCTDFEYPYTHFESETHNTIANIKAALSQVAVVTVATKVDPKNVAALEQSLDLKEGALKPEEAFLEESGLHVAYMFKTAAQADEFAKINAGKQHGGKPITILDPLKLISFAVEVIKSEKGIASFFTGKGEYNNPAYQWAFRCIEKFVQSYEPEDHSQLKNFEKLAEDVLSELSKSPKETKSQDKALDDVNLHYIKKSDSLLVVQGNKLKVLTKENGKFVVRPGIMTNKPKTPKDEVAIIVSRSALALLLTNLDLKNNAAKILRNPSVFESFNRVLQTIEKTLVDSGETLELIFVYRDIKRFVDYIIGGLFSSLKWLQTLVKRASDVASNRTSKQEINVDIPLLELTAQSDIDLHESVLAERKRREKSKLIFKNLTPNQIYSLIQILLNIDETLFAFTLHDQATSSFKKYWSHKKPRLYTAFSRLGSLLTHPSNRYSPVEIAESGLYNTQDLQYDLRHYLDPEKKIEQIQNLNPDEDLSTLLEKSLPSNRMVQGLPSGNVPLSVTLNNIPFQTHGDQPIVNLSTNESTSFVSTVSADGQVKIWNTELTLVNFGQSKFRDDLVLNSNNLILGREEKDDIVAQPLPTTTYSTNSIMSLGDPIKSTSTTTTSSTDSGLIPDAGMLETLKSMGFHIEACKKALIMVKNAGVSAALDKIFAMSDEEKNPPPPKVETKPVEKKSDGTSNKPGSSVIKPKWDCPACTFVNTNKNRLCEICGCQAPPDAYFTQDELNNVNKPKEEPKKEEKKPEPVPEKKEEKKPEEKKEEKKEEIKPAPEPPKRFLDTAKVHSNFLVPLSSSPMSPLIVGVVFEENTQTPQKYHLRLRRFAYHTAYYKRFIVSDASKNEYSLLNGAWFGTNTRATHEHLNDEFGLTFRVLEPLFMGNLRYPNTKKNSRESVLASDLVHFDEANFEIKEVSGKLLAVSVIPAEKQDGKETNLVALLWHNEASYTLQTLKVVNLVTDPYNLKDKTTFTVTEDVKQTLSVSGNLLAFETRNNSLFVATTSEVVVFSGNKFDAPQSTHKLSEAPKRARILAGGNVALINNNGGIKIIELNSSALESTHGHGSSEERVQKDEVPKVSELSDADIDSIRSVLHRKPIGGALTQGREVALESSKSELTKQYTRFYLPVSEGHQNGKSLEISFPNPASVINIELDLSFDYKGEKTTASIDEEKDMLTKIKDLMAQPELTRQISEDKSQQKNSLPLINLADAEAANKFLPLTVHSFKGASYNEKFPVAKLVSPNNELFCTNYHDSEFIFEHLHCKTIIIRNINIQSKFKPLGSCGYPIGSGLIFTASQISHFEAISEFADMSHEKFLDWKKKKLKQGGHFQPWEPVASFQFDEKSESLNVDLIYTRPCRYILLKPTSMRTKPENFNSNFKTMPIEIKFFGATGVVVDDYEAERIADVRGIRKCTGTEIKVEAQTAEGKWVDVNTFKDLDIQTIVDSSKSQSIEDNWEYFSKLPLWGSTALEFSNEALNSQKISKLRLTLNKNSDKNWQVSGLSLRAYAASNEKFQNKFSPAYIRRLLLDGNEFKKLNQQFAEVLGHENLSFERRRKVIGLISEVIETDSSFAPKFYNAIDLRNFILYAVLRERNPTFIEVQTIFRYFASDANFAKELFKALLDVLPKIPEVSQVNPVGLNGFFTLLNWCQSLDNEKVFKVLVEELQNVAKKIRDIRQGEYNLLRSQFNIPNLVLEKELFSDSNVVKKQPKKKGKDEPEKKQKDRNPLKSKSLYYASNDVDEFLVDLGQVSNIDEVRLAFEQNNKNLRFRVQIWSLDQRGKSLLHSRIYSDSTWIQLTNYAYDKPSTEPNFKPSEELECLGFPIRAKGVRYLLVQITYSLIPYIQPPNEKYDKKYLVEVYGENTTGSLEVEEINNLFNLKTIQHKDSIRYPHTATYEKYEIPSKSGHYKFAFDSSGTLTKAVIEERATQETEESLSNHLEKLQNSLLKQLANSKSQESILQNRNEVQELCDEIDATQLKLLTVPRKESSLQKPSQNLDFMYTFALKLSQNIRKIDSTTEEPEREWRKKDYFKGETGRKIALDIFENLVIYETGPINKEFISVLSQVLVNNLQESEWQLFIISVINNFLATPVNIGSTPASNIFSHVKIIEALDKISIPNGELLSYLVNKLSIPLGVTELKKKADTASERKRTEESSILCTLASVLLLLNNGFKKLQSGGEQLAPPGMKRSLSSGEKSPKQKPETTSEVKKLTYEESLQASFYIAIWICENPAFNELDKGNMLSLALDLLLQVLKFSKVQGVRNLLKDPNSFLKLFMSTMRLGRISLLNKFESVILSFLNPTLSPKDNTPAEILAEEEIIAEEIKSLLVHHLQITLKWLINYALDPENTYLPLLKGDLSANTWIEHISFILQHTISTSEKINVKDAPKAVDRKKKDDKEDLPKPGMIRSLSVSQEEKGKEISVETLDRSGALPLDVVVSLITLLSPKSSPRSGFNFSLSSKGWSLVMKAVLKVKSTTLLEAKIFDSLIGAYLVASEDIQQIMFTEIISLTQTLIANQTYQKELCTAVLDVVFTTLNKRADESFQSIAFNLLKSWLDILLTKTSPRPDKLPEKAFCKLNFDGGLSLLNNFSSLLWGELNLGAHEGVHGSNELVVVKLSIADDLLRLLITSESAYNLLAVSELFSKHARFTSDIQLALQRLIEWYLLNKTTEIPVSPATELLKSISDNLSKLFTIINEHPDVTKIAIRALVEASKRLDQVLLKLEQTEKLSAYTILQLNSRSCKTLEELFDSWVNTDSIASYVSFDVKAVEFLLDRMRPPADAQKSTVSQTQDTLLDGTDLFEVITSKDDGKEQKKADSYSNDDPREDEFASKITIVSQPGQSFSNVPPDWSTNKKGNKARILFFQMSGSTQNEYTLILQLEKTIELKQLRIGFNTVITDYSDKVFGVPTSVIVEGGSTSTDFHHIATLQPVSDEGFDNFSVKVYHKNFLRIDSSSDNTLEQAVESLASRRVSYLRFRFRRPVVTFLEKESILHGKSYKNVGVSISFLSVLGFDAKRLPDIRKKIGLVQENSALQVISKVCSNQFPETMTILANEKSVVTKIKATFDHLATLLSGHETALAPVLLAIASHNQEMGDWIINRFLDINRAKEHAKLVGEIVLSSPEYIFYRVRTVHNFVLNELKKILLLSKTDSQKKFAALIPFIETYITCLRTLPVDLAQKNAGKSFPLDVTKEDVDSVIQSFEFYNTVSNNKILIKLVLCYLFTPAPFVVEEEGIVKYVLDKLWTSINKEGKTLYFEMLGSIIIGSSASAKWFLNIIEEILTDIHTKLSTSTNIKNLRSSFVLLNNISRSEQIKRKITESGWHLKIYDGIKNKEPKARSLIKEMDNEILSLVIDFIKTTSIGKKETENELAEILIKDLEFLEKRRDINFINNILVPLLNAEADLPVCLHPYDSHSKKRPTGEEKKAQPVPESTETEDPLKSAQLTKPQTQALLKAIETLSEPTGVYKKIKGQPWTLAYTSLGDGNNVLTDLRKNVSKQGPFLLILSGTNNGKSCRVGVFCSQPFPELPEHIDSVNDQSYTIPMSDDNFYFYYEDNYTLHFPAKNSSSQKYFGQINTFYDGGGGICFEFNGSERIFISYTGSQASYVDINLTDMKPLDSDTKNGVPTDIPAEFILQSVEYWVVKPISTTVQVQKDKKESKKTSNTPLFPAWYKSSLPLNYFRATPVYSIPAALNVEKLVEIVLNSEALVSSRITKESLDPKTLLTDLYDYFVNDPTTNGIIDIEYDVRAVAEKSLPKRDLSEDAPLKYKPAMRIFESFEKNKGVERLIAVAIKSLTQWVDKEKREKWSQWLQELQSFSALPNFFGLFMKNKECLDLFIKVLTGAPDEDRDSDSKKKWEDEEQKALRFSYNILSEVFAVDQDPKVRELAIEKEFITRILDRIASVSKEQKRKWVKDFKEEEEEPESSPEKEKKKDEDEDYSKKVTKKKGVGYGSDNMSGMNSKWNVTEYMESKKMRNEQLVAMIDILHNFISVKKWDPPARVIEEICGSALLPLIEAAFRSASLLEMGKESNLNQAYLKVTRALAYQKSLVITLLDLDPHWQPAQKDSIYSLLANLKELAAIFLNCLTTADKDSKETASNQKLAQDIIETHKIVENAILNSQDYEQGGDEGEILDLLSQPLPVAYRALLKDLRFDYVSMKDPNTNQFKHHYYSNISSSNPPQTKMVRLAQELADLSTALPIDHTNAIFVRVDDTRVDVMKAVIMGAAGTPYGHGAFEYDIFFDDGYPNGPPKVNLTTTGSGKVRFNPNLYSCGKVCLSLLGTWRGNASENWDPKLSTLLQVLVSIQAVVMSDDIYFNEPGFEGEAGTDEGERKNEAYANIVRYCNIKYAMIDNIKNPPKGFETVIRRHFYLKKDEILDEVKKWVKFAEARQASYSGLVNDHNHNWCSTFKSTTTKYKEMLIEAIEELETELKNLQPPSGKEIQQKVIKKKKEKKADTNINAGVANLEEVDVSYDKDVKSKELNIDDEGVKDRWSRYIGAMGVDAVAKQASSSVFLSGVGALGVEIAKNIVLSGVKRFTLHDIVKTSHRDLSGQFFLGEEDIGKNRADACLSKIQQLNYYVKVDIANQGKPLPTDEAEIEKLIKGYNMVILTESNYKVQIAWNNYCRKNKINFISSDCYGPFARIFSDFGDEFTVIDKNGEELQEVMLGGITNEEQGVVTLLSGHKHKFEDGDEIVLNGVEGMELKEKPEVIDTTKESGSINGTKHKITVINSTSFKIGDTRGFTEYVRNGLAKQVKTPVVCKFKSLENSLYGTVPYDGNMVMHDGVKWNHNQILHVAFAAFDAFAEKHKKLPEPWKVKDSDDFIEIANEIVKKIPDFKPEEEKKYEFLLRRFAFTCQGVFNPLAAFMGGYVAQEAVKAITQKFMPTQQFFYTDCIEVIPDLPESKEELEKAIKTLGVEQKKHRSDGLRIVVGEKLLQDLAYTSLFMVGAGAIGCELLKNYAMLGVGTGEAGKNDRKEGGKIVLTDPDVIEVSNLNRQFLFREKHLRKPKSQTAAAAAIQMNKELKGHVIARLDKVHDGTSNIFTDKFFEELSVVTNALDNVQARRYVDSRCVSARTPLLESGTLGPKGHVQVIIPFKTESYGSQQDPQEEGEIPHCTLKMFPEETLHCVEWGRDKFGKLFTLRPKGLSSILDDSTFANAANQELKTLRESVVLLKKRPTTFDDCIRYARLKFQKYFVNDVRQLMYTYPLDAKTKEGRPFWSLPKRPPTELKFDPTNLLHASFVTACACLRANVFNIPIPKDARKDSGKLKIAEEAAKVKVPDFQPSAEKAKSLASEVDKADKKGDQETTDEVVDTDNAEELVKELKKLSADLPKSKDGKFQCCIPEEFEKDNDTNFHIDFIYSIANCRSSNYKLDGMDWMTVKIKAGRIIPALATTTASIAGLQSVELCKVIKKCKVEEMKNAFLSLAVPIMALGEPGSAPVNKVTDKIKVTLWDRWDVKLKKDAHLKDLIEHLQKTYELHPMDVLRGAKPLYSEKFYAQHGKEKEKETKFKAKLYDLLEFDKDDKYVDLNVTFTKPGETDLLNGLPSVRVYLE